MYRSNSVASLHLPLHTRYSRDDFELSSIAGFKLSMDPNTISSRGCRISAFSLWVQDELGVGDGLGLIYSKNHFLI